MDIKWSLLDVASRLGFGQTVVSVHDDMTNKSARITTDFQEFSPPSTYNGHVLFPLLEATSQTHMFRTGILAHAFRTRGYKPHLILCDSALDLCHPKETHDAESMCDLCRTRGISRAEKFNLKPHFLSQFLPDEYKPPEISGVGPEKYRGVNVRDHALASSRRYLRKYTVDLDSSEDRDVFRRFLQSAIVSVDAIQSILDLHSFDALIAHHPAYVVGGTLIESAKERGIPAYSHSSGYRQQNILFGMGQNRSPMAQFSNESMIKDRLSSALTDRERQWITEFMNKRAEGKDTRAFYAEDAEDGITVQNHDFTVGLFTNLMWDGSLSTDDIVFDNPFEWLDVTIEWFKKTDKYQLIIKTHPAEILRGTNQEVYAWVDQHHDLTDKRLSNIRILKPDTDVDPYSLIDQVDAGIVYNSTIGMEMAYNKTPVIVAGDTHYRNLGFTYDPDDQSDYERLLTEVESLEMTSNMVDRTLRYLYFLFNEKHISFKYHRYEDNSAKFRKVCHSEIESDDHLDLIVNRIISGDPVSYRPMP